jgi:hypothetical protein
MKNTYHICHEDSQQFVNFALYPKLCLESLGVSLQKGKGNDP